MDKEQSRNVLLPKLWVKLSNFKVDRRNLRKADNYLKVIKSLKEHGYDPEKFHSGWIKIMSNGMLVDGNHRFDSLLARFGEDHVVQFYKVGWVTHLMLKTLTTVIMSFFWLSFVFAVICKTVWMVFVSVPVWILKQIWSITLGRFFKR
jgi:hypothetical protein